MSTTPDMKPRSPEIEAQFAEMQREINFYRHAPSRFFDAWKQGVALAGYHYFGDATKDGYMGAVDKNDLAPRLAAINAGIGVKSPGEKVFLAAMYCFYNDTDGAKLCRKAGLTTVWDLTILDLQRKRIISELMLNYSGW